MSLGGAGAEVFLITATLTAAVIAADGVLAMLIRLLPARFFSYEKRFFTTAPWEIRLYRLLGVKRWKCIVPDLGCFTKFEKRSLKEPYSSDYTERYLKEATYGIVIHAANMAGGFLILPLFPTYALSVALPVALVNLLLSLLPLMLLRFNLPPLLRLHRRNLRSQQ